MITIQQGTVTATANDQNGNYITCTFSRVSGQPIVMLASTISVGVNGREEIAVPDSGTYGSLAMFDISLGWKFLLNQDGSVQWTIDVNGAVQEGNF